jgi:hypothetical protein
MGTDTPLRFYTMQCVYIFIYLFTCSLFNGPVNSNYTPSNDRIWNDELEGMWKEGPLSNLRYPGICLAGLRKCTKNPSHNSRCPE